MIPDGPEERAFEFEQYRERWLEDDQTRMTLADESRDALAWPEESCE